MRWGIPKYLEIDLHTITDKRRRNSVAYYQRLAIQTPAWSDKELVREIYKKAQRLRAWGIEVVVDHVVPLRHPYVSGLHVPANLEIIKRRVNEMKSNYFWPDCPNEQMELFNSFQEVEQYALPIQMHKT